MLLASGGVHYKRGSGILEGAHTRCLLKVGGILRMLIYGFKHMVFLFTLRAAREKVSQYRNPYSSASKYLRD